GLAPAQRGDEAAGGDRDDLPALGLADRLLRPELRLPGQEHRRLGDVRRPRCRHRARGARDPARLLQTARLVLMDPSFARNRENRSVMPARTAEISGSSRFVRDPLAAIAVPLGPIVLDGRYRLLVGALWRLGRSRRGRWAFAAGSGALVIV